MKEIQLKKVILIALVSFIVFIAYLFHIGHTPVFNKVSRGYLFLFKDSILDYIDTTSVSSVAGNDIINSFIYTENFKNDKSIYLQDKIYNSYFIDIWHFKQLSNYKLDDAFINTNSVVENSVFDFGETLDPESNCPISIKYFYKIDGIVLNCGEGTKIIKTYNEKNYKGFYGLVNKMSICSKRGEPQIYISYKKPQTPTIILLYKRQNSFYLIKINANKKLDENIIKILNLD